MISLKKYAAIDIGSNAIRLLICNIVEEPGKAPQFNKSSLVRVPIRLGQDTFTTGIIGEENILRITDAMHAYRLLMKVYRVEKYMAAATSALREAQNASEVITRVVKQTGINIEVIDGQKEAVVIASTDLHDLLQEDVTYLYVDVGGGSTEFSLFSNGKMISSKSFRIGTVRLLNDLVAEQVWQEINNWIAAVTNGYSKIKLIGSGGNINKIFKMSGKKPDTPLSYLYLKRKLNELSALSFDERVYSLGLNLDRADVIIPALRIYLNAMKQSGANQIFVPKIGLSDGIIKAMYFGRLNSYAVSH
jgi:exopolyphosphatase/guanosine-5'-triphosphate,3'-diphosphate pyrophosphatase